MGFEEEVTISGVALDETGDNYEELDQNIDPAKLGDKLIQANPLKGSVRGYQYYASGHFLLNLVEKKNAKAKKFRINLAFLSSKPERIKIVVWKWLLSALTAFALTGLFVLLAGTQIVELKYCIIAGTISLTAALIFALIFIYKMRNEFIFKSHYGNARLFLIESKKPNTATFNTFFTGLKQNINKAQSNMSVADRLVGELKMCRRLKDEGIIDDETYTIVRTAIFKHEQYTT